MTVRDIGADTVFMSDFSRPLLETFAQSHMWLVGTGYARVVAISSLCSVTCVPCLSGVNASIIVQARVILIISDVRLDGK